MLILQQNINTILNIKRKTVQSHIKSIDTPKLTTGNFMALQRKEIQFHPTETDTSSHIQETLTSHRSNPTHREKTPQLRETMTFQPAERAYKHSNLNKMKRQRNIQQVKENDKDKSPPNQNQPTNKKQKKKPKNKKKKRRR